MKLESENQYPVQNFEFQIPKTSCKDSLYIYYVILF